MEPRIVSRPAFTVAGLLHHGQIDGEKIAALWGRFFARMQELPQVVEPGIAYGVMANYDQASGEFDYIAASQVAGAEGLPQDFVPISLPAIDWAVFTTSMAELQQTYDFIYDTWLPQSGYHHGPAPEYERYGKTFDPGDPASTFEIYIPVVKA